MPAVNDNKYVVNATWDDAPHLTQAQKDELWESIPPHERDARTKGVPSLGAGAIYPIDESKYTVDDFEIPDFLPRAYAMDVGWRCTAAIWGAWDQQSDIVYLYSCYKQGLAEPATHVEAIKSRGDWIPGVIDPAAQGRAQKDGLRLFDEYQAQGLNLNLADNAVESGIFAVYRRLISGRLKVFKSLAPFFEEMRLYRRGENGKIVKDNDHLCDCLHGETLVITSDGKIKIKDLVGRTGKVLTIGGVYTNFYDCKKTHEKAATVVVRFDDGSRVRCTRDHLFMTTSGWVKAVDMAGELCYDAVTQSINNNKGDSTCSKSKFYHAVIRAVSVKSSDPCPTYCMTVPENHAFAVENGTVVHNCMRYLLMSGMQIAKSQLYADAPLYFDSKRKSVNSITGY